MTPGELQQIVGMLLNETNYYMLTAFTMAHLKALSLFNWPPQDFFSTQRKKERWGGGNLIPLTVCISEFSFLACRKMKVGESGGRCSLMTLVTFN